MIAGKRLFLTENKKKVVQEGHKDAAFLYAAPGDEIPDEAAERFGLTGSKSGAGKAEKAGDDKSEKKGEDKSATGSGLTVNKKK